MRIILISTKGRYALRILVDMAEHQREEFITLQEVAQRQDISEKYLESIVRELVKGGVVSGQRGKGGGYRLCRPPEQIKVGEILRCTEGSLAPVACLTEGAAPCSRTAGGRAAGAEPRRAYLLAWRGGEAGPPLHLLQVAQVLADGARDDTLAVLVTLGRAGRRRKWPGEARAPSAGPPAPRSPDAQGGAYSSHQVELCRSRCPHRALPAFRQGLAAP